MKENQANMGNPLVRLIEKSYDAAKPLPAGSTTLTLENQCSQGEEVLGMAQADQAVTLSFFWGFNGIYLIKEADVVVPADMTEGAGIVIGPFIPKGLQLKVVANNGGAATPNFLIALYSHG